jgi:hypothetical protein
MPRKYRNALYKFRCGVAPIRIETGRYERLNVTDRISNICDNHDNEIEDEKHVIMKCTLYDERLYFQMLLMCVQTFIIFHLGIFFFFYLVMIVWFINLPKPAMIF